MQIGVGISEEYTPKEALRKSFRKASSFLNIKHKKILLVLIFYTYEFSLKELFPYLEEIREIALHVIAIKTYRLLDKKGTTYPGVGTIIFGSNSEDIEILTFPNIKHMRLPEDIERGILSFIRTHRHITIRSILNIINPYIFRISGFIQSLQNIFGKNIPILGFSPAQDLYFKTSEFYYNGKLIKEGIISIIFTCAYELKFYQTTGFFPLAKDFIITKSYENIIQEIDNLPASKMYEELFPKEASNLRREILPFLTLNYPIGFNLQEDKICIRHTIKVLDDDSLFTNGEILEGTPSKLLIGARPQLLKTSQSIFRKINQETAHYKLCLYLPSIAHFRILGSDVEREMKAVYENLGSLRFIGIPTYKNLSWEFLNISFNNVGFQNNDIMAICI